MLIIMQSYQLPVWTGSLISRLLQAATSAMDVSLCFDCSHYLLFHGFMTNGTNLLVYTNVGRLTNISLSHLNNLNPNLIFSTLLALSVFHHLARCAAQQNKMVKKKNLPYEVKIDSW